MELWVNTSFCGIKIEKATSSSSSSSLYKSLIKKRKQNRKTLTKNLWNKINRIPPAWYIQCWDFRLGCFSSHSLSVPNIIYRRKKLLFGPSPSRFVPFHVSAILWEWKRFSVAMCNDWSLRHNRKSSQNRHTHTRQIPQAKEKRHFFIRSKKTQQHTKEKSKHEWEWKEERRKKQTHNTPSVKSLNNKRSDFYV